MDKMRNCGHCQHFEAGQCWRYPPQMVLWPNDNQHPVIYSPYATRPTVGVTTPACGEYRRQA